MTREEGICNVSMMGKNDTMKIENSEGQERIVDEVFPLNWTLQSNAPDTLNLDDASADISGIGRVRSMCLRDLPFLFQAQA